MTPRPVTSFLSLTPLEPVLVFATAEDAEKFRKGCVAARRNSHEHPEWVYVPLPNGLLRVYTARLGDVGYDFRHAEEAKAFNAVIGEVGTIHDAMDKKHLHRVYLGNHKK